jgi:tRNA pseudouridine55 synthase
MTGFVVIDKREGVTSTKEVSLIKKLTGMPCGHMGTLDPMASGVLPVAIGNAARLFDYFLDKKKVYRATFLFGEDSDTLDTMGEIISYGGRVPTENEIREVIPKLCGEVDQIPPRYSAKNVNGTRGYVLAREGVEFELPPKKVNIYSIDLIKRENENSFSFEIVCGGGTYIRSIARDMGKLLGTSAIMSALVRTESGQFNLNMSVKSEVLNKENIQNFVIPTDSILPFDNIHPDEKDAKKLFNGLTVQSNLPEGLYKIYDTNGLFYGLAQVNNHTLKVRTKLC